MVLSHGPDLAHRSMGSLLRSAHGLFFLSVQAEEGRRAPKAKVAKIIKEAILLFSGHHLFLFYHNNIYIS